MKKKAFLIISLGFALAANLYFRTFTVNFPQLRKQAKEIVNITIQQGTMQEVYKRFPQFYPLAKDEIKKSSVNEYQRHNKKFIREQVENLYKKMKDRYQDDKGQTYLMELDCWHWTRYVENILRLGHPGDRVINGAQWDMMMLAPTGWKILWDNFLYYLSAFLYKAFCVFHAVPMRNFLFYLPLFFITIFVVTLYSVAYRYGSYLGATITCLFTGLAPVFIPRSCAGWFDKDVLSMLFPIAIFGAYISSMMSPSGKGRLLWLSLASFLVGLFAFTWTFWWFIFFIIIGCEALLIAYDWISGYLNKRSSAGLKERLITLVFFIFTSFLWVALLAGLEPLAELYNQVRLALIFNKPLMTSIWPNVYATVGEMRKSGLKEMFFSLGGRNGVLPIGAALISAVIIFIRSAMDKKCEPFRRSSIVMLMLWLAAMAFATTRGVRFVMFLAAPLGLALGWAVNDLYKYLRLKNKAAALAASAVIFIALGAVFINNGYSSASSCFPIMDDTWYKVLNIAREKTPKETIINSWWDFGDWFKVVAGRRVIFDGQSQGTPQAYWMAKALLTDDETKAVRILRMLNNGGNEAFNIMDERIKNPLLSVLLLERVMMLDPERASGELSKFLPPVTTERVMEILFGTPPRACFVVDSSMVHKIGAVSYLGNWDFARVYIAQNFNREEKGKIIGYLKEFGRSDEELQRFYQEAFLISTKNLDEWLSRRLQFYSGTLDGQEKNGLIFFQNGFAYDPKARNLRSSSGQVPLSMFFTDGDKIAEKEFQNPNAGYSVLVYKADTGYKLVMMDRELGKSIFVRLYFLRGAGLKHFVPFIDAEEGDMYVRFLNIIW